MELLKEVGLFVWAVINGWAGYATGGIIVATIALWHTLRNSPISRKAGIILAAVFLLMAFFKAWQEQYERANKISPPVPIQVNNQVNVPPINVPPSTVIVQRSSSSDLTGILQMDKLEPVTNYNVVAEGKQIQMDVFYKNVGTQPIHDKLSYEGIGFAEPDSEQKIRKEFAAARKKNHAKDIADKVHGNDIAVNVPIFRTAFSLPLTKPQADGIIDGSTRLYLMFWAIWKDSHNKTGKLDYCFWMQRPPSPILTGDSITWHSCD